MNLREFETMTEIVPELHTSDKNQLTGFASDCIVLGATQTAKYIKDNIDNIWLSNIKHYLSCDFSGC